MARILAIPFKRFVQVMSGFLSRQEVQAILGATTDTWTGRRDHLLFLLLYMGLLEAGITTEVVALFLGHETPKTTHLYMEASLAMKKQALEKVSAPKSKRSSFQPDDGLLCFLENL